MLVGHSIMEILALAICKNTKPHYYAQTNFLNSTNNVENIDRVVGTILAATKDALQQCLPSSGARSDWEWKHVLQQVFKSIWCGLAGLDRSGLQDKLGPKLADTFGLQNTPDAIRLTNDVGLLTAAISPQTEASSAIVLISGTGSVAMRYSYSKQYGYTCTARSGGWGHILGDEGGGYSIGLAAIKHTLDALEGRRLEIRHHPLGNFEQAVLKSLGFETSGGEDIDLLTDILSKSQNPGITARIAGVAETLLALEGDEIARAILEEQISQLTQKTLGKLTNPTCKGFVSPENTELVLGGGLMRNENYRKELQRQLAEQHLFFRGLRVVDDAAVAGVNFLISKND